MKSSKTAFLILILGLMIGCGDGGGSSSPVVVNPILADNALLITVNGSLCGADNAFLNKPCVSVTICTLGSATCQRIDDILLDTGSFGLRIFSQVLTNVSLTQVSAGSGSLAECIQFADGTSIWGPVKMAKVKLANEPAVDMPIQVIDSTFGITPPNLLPPQCRNSRTSPSDAGYSGILGVGLLDQDCGSECVSFANNGIYYTCSGGSCIGTTVPISSQVRNPVAALTQDNNGVIVKLPSVPVGGAPSVNGSLVFGIGTGRINNSIPSQVVMYSANASGSFDTTLNNTNTLYSGVIDTGSNGLFFSTSLSSLPSCSSNPSWFCPSFTQNLSATNTAATGSPPRSGTVSFEIANFNSLINSSNSVFDNIGGSGGVGRFDWGLPFFFGRDVFVGIEGKSNPTLGTGPYWAY